MKHQQADARRAIMKRRDVLKAGVATAVARLHTGVIGPSVALHLGYNATMVAALYVTAGV